MKALKQLGFLRLLPGRPTPVEEDGRVLALYRNRAELKKAYSELQDEVYRLRDRIKQQEGATARVQEMLSALEERLAAPETAYSTIVFYQLRSLWRTGREILEQFVADLTKQQEERERRMLFAEHNRRQFARRQALESRLRAAERAVADAHREEGELKAAHARLGRLWHYFRRRNIERRLHAARTARAATERALAEARAAVERLEAEPIPEYPGLSLEARRTINLAAIAYAEVQCLRLADTRLVELARAAVARREATEDYGTRADCEAMMAAIARARAILESRANVAQDVKARTDRLRQIARYRSATDTTPLAESIGLTEGDVLAGQPLGRLADQLPNVLADDTWDLFRVLLR